MSDLDFADLAVPRPSSGHVTHDPEVWAAAREDYLEGMSGPEVCGRYGLRLGTFRARASSEGWRRRDQPVQAPIDEGAELEARYEGDLDQIEYSDLAFVASRRMMRAVLRGNAAEALRWKRVKDIMDAEHEAVERFIAEEEAWMAIQREAAENAADHAERRDAFLKAHKEAPPPEPVPAPAPAPDEIDSPDCPDSISGHAEAEVSTDENGADAEADTPPAPQTAREARSTFNPDSDCSDCPDSISDTQTSSPGKEGGNGFGQTRPNVVNTC